MGISVLLVEDKEQMLQIAEHYLQSDYMDFTITRVNSGKDALQRFESGSYDLVIFGTDISENDKNALISMLDETKRECQFILLTERASENERSKELSAFKLITEASVREMSINDFCHHVLTGIIEGMGFDSGSLRLYNSAKETLEPVAIYGYSISEAEQIKTEQLDDESMLVSYIARTGIPLFVPRVRESEIFKRFKNRFEVFKAESVISYPIFGKGGQLLGVITLSAKTQGRVTERNQDFFETVAELLASALEKKYAEILLAESEEKYRTFVENSLEGIIVYDRENLIYFNPRVYEMLGIEQEDVSSFTLDSVVEFIHPDDRKKAIELFGRVLESDRVDARNELRFITPRGNMVYIDTYTRKTTTSERVRAICKYIAA